MNMQSERIDRLKAAIEGECNGLAISDNHARAILDYVDAAPPADHSEDARQMVPSASAPEAEAVARAAVEQFKLALYQVPYFADRVNKATREKLSEAHSIVLNLPALLDQVNRAAPAPSASPAALTMTNEQRKALEAVIHDYEERGFNRMPRVLRSLLAASPADHSGDSADMVAEPAMVDALTLDAIDIEFLSARLRRLFAHFGYKLPAFAEDDKKLIRIAPSCIGAVLANLAEPARASRQGVALSDEQRRSGFSCAKRAADPQNESAACRQWCGDSQRCMPGFDTAKFFRHVDTILSLDMEQREQSTFGAQDATPELLAAVRAVRRMEDAHTLSRASSSRAEVEK